MKNKPTADLPLVNPYPGLRPYGENESRWFFGRSRETRDLLDRLTFHRFVAVMGSSGCGKSSLVRASLIPALRAGYNSTVPEAWRIATMRPGNNPIGRLAEALTRVLYPSDPDPDGRSANLAEELRGGSLGILRILREAHLPSECKLFVLVDQFEELFTIAEKNRDLPQGEVRDFIQLLLDSAWTRDFPIHVVITMRSENLGLCSRFADLAKAINDGLFLVPRLALSRLRDVIEFPVEQDIEPALVTKLINDLGGGTDDLPILQHALMRLWDARSLRDPESPISLDDLDKVGDVGETIGKQIEEEILGPLEADGKGDERELVFGLFLEITEVGDDGQMNRQPKRFDELCRHLGCDADRLTSLIERFRKEGCSFLQPSQNETPVIGPGTLIDVSHESLIRQWEALRVRARERKLILDEIDLVEKTARDWERHGRDPGGLEPGGRRLGRARELLGLRPLDFSKVGQEFVEESLREATRIARRAKIFQSIVAAIVAGLLYFGAFFIHFKQVEAERAKAEAALSAVEAANAEMGKANADRDRLKAEAAKSDAERKASNALAEQKEAEAEALEATVAREQERAKAALAETKAALAEKKAALAEKKAAEALVAKEDEQVAIKAANAQQLRELEIALQREKAEAQLKENRNREAMSSLVAISYQALVGTREYSDADRQLEGFPIGKIHYLGEEISREEIEEVVSYEARVWPIRRFATLGEPRVEVSDNLEDAKVVAWFHYEYRGETTEGKDTVAPPMAAGFFRETCRFKIGESLTPVLVSLERAPVSRDELRLFTAQEFERLTRDQRIGFASTGEEIAKNRFWFHEIGRPEGSGTVVSAPEVEVSGTGSILATGVAYRLGALVDGLSEPEGWFVSEITVDVNTGDYTSSEKTAKGFVGVPLMDPTAGSSFWVTRLTLAAGNIRVSRGIGRTMPGEIKGPAEESVEVAPPGPVTKGMGGTPSSTPAVPGFPWPPSHRYVKEQAIQLSRDKILNASLKEWAEGNSSMSVEEVARNAGELYILCSNPNPIREQIDFYSDAGEEGRVRFYYDLVDQDHSFVVKDLLEYKQKRPERSFQVSPDSTRVVELANPDDESENEVTVRVPFLLKNDSTSNPVEMGADITFLILPKRWPVITRIGTSPKEVAVDITFPFVE